VPHSPQNFAGDVARVPQPGHATKSRSPHSPQNF
jgi:hypothetical protein